MTIARFFLLIAATLCASPTSILRANNHDGLVEGQVPIYSTSMFRDDFNKNYELFRNIFGAPKS